jgi:hypothetical protein
MLYRSSARSGSVLLLAALVTGALQAQTSMVALVGAAVDSIGAPIAGAEVRVEPGPRSVLTDSLGGFWLDSLTPGKWTARIRKPGFNLALLDFTIPEGARGEVELNEVVLHPAQRRAVTFAGTVRDAISRSPVDAVSITVGENPATTTDVNGHFLQRVIIRGNASVDLTHVGFQRLHFDLWPATEDTVTLAIGLRPLAVQLEEIVVKGASAGAIQPSAFEQHRRSGFGTFLTRERIGRIASVSALELLRWAGVQVSGDAFAEQGRSLRVLGTSYTCGGLGPIIFIDGRRWPTESATAYLEATDPKEIIGVEVYTHAGGIPVEYNGPDAECGVAALWFAH